MLAAKKLSLQTVPVLVARGWSQAQVRAYIIADNQLALNAGWDVDLLRGELFELKNLEFDLALTGFDLDHIRNVLAVGTEGLADPDETSDLPARPVTELGDLWIIGDHRLLCGGQYEREPG